MKKPRRKRRGWTRRRHRATIKPDGGPVFLIAAASVSLTGAVLLARAVYGLISQLSMIVYRRSETKR